MSEIAKIREGIVEYRVVGGIVQPRKPTACEKTLKQWSDCVKEGVRITSDIAPQVGPNWDWRENAFFEVKVANRTGYFLLEDVEVRWVSVEPKEGKAEVIRAGWLPEVVKLGDILPGATGSTMNPVVPGQGGFFLLSRREFPGDDFITAKAEVTYKAVPYLKGSAEASEPIRGT